MTILIALVAFIFGCAMGIMIMALMEVSKTGNSSYSYEEVCAENEEHITD